MDLYRGGKKITPERGNSENTKEIVNNIERMPNKFSTKKTESILYIFCNKEFYKADTIKKLDKKTRLFWSIVLFILISPDIALSFSNSPKEAYLVTKDGTIINATAIEKIGKILTFETNGLPGFVKTSEVVKILTEDPSKKTQKSLLY